MKKLISSLVLTTFAAAAPAQFDHAHFELFDAPSVPEEVSLAESDLIGTKAVITNPDFSVQSSVKIAGPIGSPASTVTGALDGKIVYLMAGHGWTYGSGTWSTQRGKTFEMVEDFGNLDQATMMAEFLLNAGATVVPMRPFGIQEQEVVIDNDDAACTFTGTWSVSSATNFYGTTGDVPYRFASVVTGAPTHTAVYNASALLPTSDYYPVYVWTRSGPDRIEQEYIVAHSGGTVSRRINHQRVGGGWMYLGTYYFEQGGPASVTITNTELPGDPGGVVIADAVRFGNGMGDTVVEGVASGYPRHEENAEYWLAESRGVGSGLTTSGSVSSPPRLAAYMNYEGGTNSGTDTDRVYLSFHSNAGGGRGADGLFNNTPPASCDDPSTVNSFGTPNGVEFAQELGTRVNTDMTTITNAVGNPFENTWGQGGSGTNLFGSACGSGGGFSAYGEINNSYINDEMAATIIEVGFHDNELDAELMRDPKAREAISRAVMKGVVNHFNSVSGSPLIYAPEQADNPWIESDPSGALTLRWTPPVAGGPFGGVGGSAPTGYIVEVSDNGFAFSPAMTVAGGSSNSADVTAHVAVNQHRYFRVVATNAGGVSFPSIVVGAQRGMAKARSLVINGFDRYDRTLNFRQPYGGGAMDRVIPRLNNSFDYTVQVGDALAAAGVAFDSAQNDQVISGAIDLSDYSSVYWILGAESTVDSAFDATEQAAVTTFLAGNGNLFLSGSEAAWDLGRVAASAGNKTFLQTKLKVTPFSSGNAEDSAGTYTAQGTGGGIFASLGSVSFSDGSDIHGMYDVAYPDVLNPTGGSVSAMSYVGGTGGSAAITYDGNGSGAGRVVYLGFPFETILDETDRTNLMAAVVDFFGSATKVDAWMILGD